MQSLRGRNDGPRTCLRRPGRLAGPRLAEKLAVTRSKGARHASVRFVTGALDVFHDRAEMLSLAARVTDPTGALRCRNPAQVESGNRGSR